MINIAKVFDVQAEEKQLLQGILRISMLFRPLYKKEKKHTLYHSNYMILVNLCLCRFKIIIQIQRNIVNFTHFNTSFLYC